VLLKKENRKGQHNIDAKGKYSLQKADRIENGDDRNLSIQIIPSAVY